MGQRTDLLGHLVGRCDKASQAVIWFRGARVERRPVVSNPVVVSEQSVSSNRHPQRRFRPRGVGITDVGLQRDHNEDSFAVLS